MSDNRCADCTMPQSDRHHDPDYRMDRVPWDIPRHPFRPEADEDCHEDCGPIVERIDNGLHVHENEDGYCYHSDDDEDEHEIVLMVW